MFGKLRRHLWGGYGAAALLAVFAGCQDQSVGGGLPLGAADSKDPQSITARMLFSDPCQDVPNKSAVSRELVKAVNAERAKQRIAPLKVNDTLTQLAEFYACRLADGGFFAHVDPVYGSTVESRAADFGYAFLNIGENLAAGQESVEQAISAWMNSPDHRAVLLNPAFTEVGVAVKKGGPSGPYWVQEFGRPVTAGEEGAAVIAVPTSTAAETAGKSSQPPSH